MAEPYPIRFEDGADYERLMGAWSRLAGAAFLDWVAPPPGLVWLDVGCGSGAFTELLLERARAASVVGVDPSSGQLDHARRHLAGRAASFHEGDAMALPVADAAFGAAAMALVIFFVPEPTRGVAEMARAVRPGGLVASYAWDISGGGFPHEAMRETMRALGMPVVMPPSVDAADLDALIGLWGGAGLVDIETRVITVEQRFDDAAAYWQATRAGPGARPPGPPPTPEQMVALREGAVARLARDAAGRIIVSARAHAVRGRVPQ